MRCSGCACPYAGPPGSSTLPMGAGGGGRFVRSKHALTLNWASSFVIASWLRVVGCCCLSLCCVVVADTLSLRAGGVDNLLRQACVFGQTHASVDAHSLTHRNSPETKNAKSRKLLTQGSQLSLVAECLGEVQLRA